jgi:zinc transporter, ZIP family
VNEYLMALAFAAMPAFGNFVGGVLAEMFDASARTLSRALHAAAGIVLAVVAVELLPEAFEAASPLGIILAFVAGGCFFVLLDRVIGIVKNRFGGEGGAGPWVIFFGVAIDLFSDGVMIGAGSTLSFGLGLLLALGQVPADIPEGFATIATFKGRGVPRTTRLLLAASFALPIFLGTTIGYWAVRDAPEIYRLALLAFVAGMLIMVAVEEMLTEAHAGQEDSPIASLAFVGGFALFAVLSTYLGG